MYFVPSSIGEYGLLSPAIERAVNALRFVAQHVKNEDNFDEVDFVTSLTIVRFSESN